MRYFYVYDGTRTYGKNHQELRMRVLGLVALTTKLNMEACAPIYQENNGVVTMSDKLYLKELKDGRVYFCYEDCNAQKTFRSYYDLNDVWWSRNEKEVPWIEIVSMRGKALLAKDVYA